MPEETVETLSDNNAENDGLTPLILAAKEEDQQGLLDLLSNGADINERNDFGDTALIYITKYVCSISFWAAVLTCLLKTETVRLSVDESADSVLRDDVAMLRMMSM
nr:uncharacterized protein LOC123747882 isoform X1 [Procambarus clarkii]